MLKKLFIFLVLLFTSCNNYVIEDQYVNISTYLVNNTENVSLEIYSIKIDGYDTELINSCVEYDNYIKLDDIKIDIKDNTILYKIYSKVFIDNKLYYNGLIYIPVEIKNNEATLDLYYGCDWYCIIDNIQYKLLPLINIEIEYELNKIEYNIIIE